MSPNSRSAFAVLQSFARDVKSKAALGERFNAQPEDHLKTSVANFVTSMGNELGLNVEAVPEARVDDVGGRPDLAVTVSGLLVGYVELKAPGVGTTDRELKGRNKKQLKRFLNLPNLLYTDARDWTFYKEGKRQTSHDVRLGDIDETGETNLSENDAINLMEVLREFLGWEPIVPANPRALAEQLAPMTRVVRTDVAEGVHKSGSALAGIYADWRRTLFPEATPDEFADSYAQTLTYGLLLAKLSGGTALNTHLAAQTIQHHSSLLSRTLEILTQHGTADELGPGLRLLERTIDAVNPAALRSDGEDPWLYFYEDFLAVYDAKLRNERGVYYTPAQVVKAQVTLVDELLRTKLNKPLGVADNEVTVLDPAVGTGTYLLRILQKGVKRAESTYGRGAVASIVTQMARNLYGFELLVGPYAVAHLRLTQAVREAGGREPSDGVHVYLTDTLESPNEVSALPHSYFEEPLADEYRRAREVKRDTPILVCIGNPPYEREISDPGEVDRPDLGGWIRFGDKGTTDEGPLLEDFLRPARAVGAGGVMQPVYNLYVYFWRWALWKVFETQTGPGIISFITASSYLRGPGFVGMREHMRRSLDEIWILDLEGDSLGTRATENVFDIRIPVAIVVAVRYDTARPDESAKIHYARVTGTRSEKLAQLDAATDFDGFDWQPVQKGWHSPFIPESEGDYFAWPPIEDVFPWARVGSLTKRGWPVSESRDVLENRYKALFSAPPDQRGTLLVTTSSRNATSSRVNRLNHWEDLPAISSQSANQLVPTIVRYGFRSFDRQWIIADERFIDRPAAELWQTQSTQQLYLTTSGSLTLGAGPALTCSAYVPDQHHFNGRGGKDVMPLYRDAAATEPNITRGLTGILEDAYDQPVSPEDLASYVSGVLAHPSFTETFHAELETPGPRVPLTRDGSLFRRAVELGRQVIAWQTYAERFPEALGTTPGQVPNGSARVKVAIPEESYPLNLYQIDYDEQSRELRIGEGVIENVDSRIWMYEVSGLRIVRSWLGFRMKERSGRKSSDLDSIRPERWSWEMTKELLELLWVLEGVIALEPLQAELLDEIVAGDLFLADELPKPTEAERAAPRVERQQQLGLDLS